MLRSGLLVSTLILPCLIASAAAEEAKSAKQTPANIISGIKPRLPQPPISTEHTGSVPAMGQATASTSRGLQELPARRQFTRTIRLSDLGYPEGLRIGAGGGSREIFLNLPRSFRITNASMTVSYEAAAAFEGRRSLEVDFGDRSVLARPITVSGVESIDMVSLPVSQTRQDFLKLAFRVGRTVTENRCVDLRVAGEYFTLLPSTEINFTFEAPEKPTVASILAALPQNVAITVPQRQLSDHEMAAAIIAYRAIAASGRKPVIERMGDHSAMAVSQTGPNLPWQEGRILIATPDEIGLTASDMGDIGRGGAGVAYFNGLPGLYLTGRRPDLAASSLNGGARTGLSSALTYASRSASSGLSTKLMLDELPNPPQVAELAERATWSTTFGAKDLPVRTRATGFKIDAYVSPDEARTPTVFNVIVNEQLLGGAVTSDTGRARLDVNLPEGLAGMGNTLRVVAQRQPKGGDCMLLPPAYPAQLLPSSEVSLSASAERAADFHDLPPLFRSGIDILVERTTEANQLSELQAAALLTSQLTHAETPVNLLTVERDTKPSPQRPFISLVSTSPENSHSAVSFEHGRVQIVDAGGKILHDIGGLDAAGVAQIAESNGQQGLWVRPTANGALPNLTELKLDRGNVALFDKEGVAFAFAQGRDRLARVVYPDELTWSDTFARHRPLALALAWLAASLMFLKLLGKMLKGRKSTAA